MSNTKRPTTARKVTPADEKKRNAELDEGIRFKIPTDADPDGEWFYLRMADVTPRLAREVRATLGKSFRKLMDQLLEDADIDVLSEAVWVARRIKGEQVDLDDVLVDYGVMLSDAFDIDEAGPRGSEDEGDLPEA